MSSQDDFELISDVIRRRETKKVLADPESPCDVSATRCAGWDATVRDSLRTAGYAPFHYERNIEEIAEPWRAT